MPERQDGGWEKVVKKLESLNRVHNLNLSALVR